MAPKKKSPKKKKAPKKLAPKRPPPGSLPPIDEPKDVMQEVLGRLPKELMQEVLARLPINDLLRLRTGSEVLRSDLADCRFMMLFHTVSSKKSDSRGVLINRITDAVVGNDFNREYEIRWIPGNGENSKVLQLPTLGESEDWKSFEVAVSAFGVVLMKNFLKVKYLWNPTLDFMVNVRLENRQGSCCNDEFRSYGLAFHNNDVKVIFIGYLGYKCRSVVQVYSTKTQDWVTIRVRINFRVLSESADVVINGNPYWVAELYEKGKSKNCMVSYWSDGNFHSFNSSNLNLVVEKRHYVNLEEWKLEKCRLPLVEWNGKLGVVEWKKPDKTIMFNILVYDWRSARWTKAHEFGPLEVQLSTDRLRCWPHKLVCQSDEGILVFDSVNKTTDIIGEVEDGDIVRVHDYVKGIMRVPGMKRIKLPASARCALPAL